MHPSGNPLDNVVFVFDNVAKKLTIDQPAPHSYTQDLMLTVGFVGYTIVTDQLTFTIQLNDECEQTTITIGPSVVSASVIPHMIGYGPQDETLN